MDRIVNRLLAAVVIAFALCGCAATLPSADGLNYKSRAVTRVEGGLQVSASVLSAEESEAVYGVPLAQKGIQPVWIEVQNNDTVSYFLMSPGLDPNFFPASEAAEAFADSNAPWRKRRTRPALSRARLPQPSACREQTVSGYVLTNLSEGAKLVQLDLVASGQAKTFLVPDGRARLLRRLPCQRGLSARDLSAGKNRRTTRRTTRFALALEALPCCATNEDGSKNGDPLNLVIVGGLDDAFPALVRRGWSPTEQKWSGAIMKTIVSALSGDRYVNAPVSDLYLFGRAQDLALQKARDTIHQRNHLRLWLSPMRYQGKPVWVGQISRDIGIRLTFHSPNADNAQDRPGRRRGAHSTDRGHGLFPEPSEDRIRQGSRRRLARRPERESHHRPLLHRRLSPGTRIRSATHFALRNRILALGGSREVQRPALGSKTMSAWSSLRRGLKNTVCGIVALAHFYGLCDVESPVQHRRRAASRARGEC